MAHQRSVASPTVWLGQTYEPFNGGELWVGRHSADKDVLIFDPTAADPCADPLAFYSLAQHRTRTFPRVVVDQKIRALTDDDARARAESEYADRLQNEAAHQLERDQKRSERAADQRQSVLDAHRRYLEEIGVAYSGVRENAPARRRRSRCHRCGISLDNFADAVCDVCGGVLCSCGACACRPAEPAH
ncbi:MAG TPA: hypothetical protein VFL93_14115 [Longimicrobiaceae bacterium]|nr:hypothetical protein [Longimicrobiaceae bacterium]